VFSFKCAYLKVEHKAALEEASLYFEEKEFGDE
jgi:hypothetical protein